MLGGLIRSKNKNILHQTNKKKIAIKSIRIVIFQFEHIIFLHSIKKMRYFNVITNLASSFCFFLLLICFNVKLNTALFKTV